MGAVEPIRPCADVEARAAGTVARETAERGIALALRSHDRCEQYEIEMASVRGSVVDLAKEIGRAPTLDAPGSGLVGALLDLRALVADAKRLIKVGGVVIGALAILAGPLGAHLLGAFRGFMSHP